MRFLGDRFIWEKSSVGVLTMFCKGVSTRSVVRVLFAMLDNDILSAELMGGDIPRVCSISSAESAT